MCEHDAMTQLSSYIKGAGMTQRAFAAAVNIAPGHLSEIITGKKRPGLALAFAIERQTLGQVPASSWVPVSQCKPALRQNQGIRKYSSRGTP
jgi:transcriptional regulator with XRE-family HTH domain